MNNNNEKSAITSFSQDFDPSTHIWGDSRIVLPLSNRVEHDSVLYVSVIDKPIIDIIDVDNVHLSLFGPCGRHMSISEKLSALTDLLNLDRTNIPHSMRSYSEATVPPSVAKNFDTAKVPIKEWCPVDGVWHEPK